MKRREITSLLIGLIFICSISGYNTVICHGSDGHTCFEPVNHNHCDCSIELESSIEIQETHSQIPDYLSIAHVHCNDTLTVLNLFLTKSNIPAKSITKTLTLNYHNVNTTHTNNNIDSYTFSNSNNLSAFFIQLESIIILA